MKVTITGRGKISKKLEIKRGKVDEVEVLHCHLSVEHIEIKRETIDELCRQDHGWAAAALYDELGAPRARFELALKDLQLEVRGRIRGEQPRVAGKAKGALPPAPEFNLVGANVTRIRFELVPVGALMSLRFTWQTAGDEADDCSGLLGREAELQLTIEGNPNADAFPPGSEALKAAAAKAAKPAKRSRARGGAK